MSLHYLPGRDELLATATTWLATHDPEPSIVDLGSGPGTTLRRLRQAFPRARLIGIDNDSVLRTLHQISTPPSPSIEIVDTDLTDCLWINRLPPDYSPSAVLAVQVLHYFYPDRFAAVLAEIRSLLKPGGALIHIDVVPSPPGRRHGAATPAAKADRGGQAKHEPWTAWWRAAARHPLLADAIVARSDDPDGSGRPAEYHPDQDQLDHHIRAAGFRSIAHRTRHSRSLLTIAQA